MNVGNASSASDFFDVFSPIFLSELTDDPDMNVGLASIVSVAYNALISACVIL